MDQTLTDIVNTIVQHVNPTRIYLFGSRARGDHRLDSDYDITLIYDGELSKRDVKVRIRKQFVPPGFSMDLFVLTSKELDSFKHVGCSLAREIAENGKLIYEQRN